MVASNARSVLGMGGRAGLAVLGCVVLTASTSTNDVRAERPRRFAPTGIQGTPAAPLLPGRLPDGWRIRGRELRLQRGASASQAVFMPPKSTAAAGPALAAGYVSDDQGAPNACDGADVSTYPPPAIQRWGSRFTMMSVRAPGFVTAAGYVLGRDVSDDVLREAAASVSWVDEVTPPSMALPAGFALKATSGLAPSDHFGPVRFRLDDDESHRVWVGETESNPAGVFVAQFWASLSGGRACTHDGWTQRTIIRRGTVIRMSGDDSRIVRRVVDSAGGDLRPVSRREFCRVTSRRIGDPPGTCRPPG